jgi:hypothetical protein
MAPSFSVIYDGEGQKMPILALLAQFPLAAAYAQGYGPANLVTLLRVQRGHLRGLDLGRLTLRGVS